MTDPLFNHIFNNWDLTGLKNINNLFSEVSISQETFDYALSKMSGENIEYMRDFVNWDTSSSSNGSVLILDLSK